MGYNARNDEIHDNVAQPRGTSYLACQPMRLGAREFSLRAGVNYRW